MSPMDFLSPLWEYGFMKRSLVAGICLALSCGPVGVFLLLRRMALMGDAIGHGILPGAAIGFVVGGLSLAALGTGGLIAGIVIALAAGAITRLTPIREDASFASFYLISLAFGVLIVSLKGSHVDLIHILFGSILAIDRAGLTLICATSSLTLLALALLWRPLVAECLDPEYLRSVGRMGPVVHLGFLVLVVINLIASFQAMGTLLSVGLMMLPASSSRFWCRRLLTSSLLSMGLILTSVVCGLLASYHGDWPSGPSIVLVAGSFWAISLLFGVRGGLISRFYTPRHLKH